MKIKNCPAIDRHFVEIPDFFGKSLATLHVARTEKNTYDVKTGKPTNPTPADGIFWRHESKRWDSLRQTKMFISAKTVVEYPCLYER